MNLGFGTFGELETSFSRRGLSSALDGAQYYAAAESVRGLAGGDFGTSAPAPRQVAEAAPLFNIGGLNR